MLRHFSRSKFENAVSGYNGDFKIRALSCWDLFKSMLYALISNCFSVRDIETSMRVNGNRLYHAGLKQIKRSTFCDALERRKNGILKSVFNKLSEKAQNISGKMKKKFKDPLRIIDATVISLCLARFNWVKYRNAKGAVKLHLGSLDIYDIAMDKQDVRRYNGQPV
jgi:hypothetical protein